MRPCENRVMVAFFRRNLVFHSSYGGWRKSRRRWAHRQSIEISIAGDSENSRNMRWKVPEHNKGRTRRARYRCSGRVEISREEQQRKLTPSTAPQKRRKYMPTYRRLIKGFTCGGSDGDWKYKQAERAPSDRMFVAWLISVLPSAAPCSSERRRMAWRK